METMKKQNENRVMLDTHGSNCSKNGYTPLPYGRSSEPGNSVELECRTVRKGCPSKSGGVRRGLWEMRQCPLH